MKKGLSLILIAFTMMVFFGFTSNLKAAETCVYVRGELTNGPMLPTGTEPAAGERGCWAAANQVGDEANAGDDGWLSWLNPLTWLPTALGWLSFLVLKVVSLILGIAGLLLNFVINHTVVNMAENIKDMTGINIVWKVARDLMNIAFIFLLVYEGILMIIGQGSKDKVYKFVSGIVLASLLINFSLFFTKVIIDASNVVTIGLYNNIIVSGGNTSGSSAIGLADAYQGALGLQGFLSADGFSQIDGDNYSMLVVGIMASILFLITAFIFLAVSVLFIVRYIVLIILLALSPVAYMGMSLLPGIKAQSNKWWSTLWGQVLFGPIYMFMTWLVLILVNSEGFMGEKLDPNKWSAFANNDITEVGASISLMFNFAVVIGLAVASLVTAKSVATQGASQVKEWSGKATAFAGGAIMGGTARFSRATLGRRGADWANDEELKDKAANGSRVARMKLAAGTKMASSSFDARATKGFGNLSKTTGVDFGKVDPKKVNYKAIREAQEKAAAEKAKIYKPSDAFVAEKKAEAKEQDEAALALADQKVAETKLVADEATANHKKVEDEIKEDDKKIAEMTKELGKTVMPEMKEKIKADIARLEEEKETKTKNLGELNTLMANAVKVSEEAAKAKKDYKKEEDKVDDAMKKIFKDRVTAVGNRVGHEKEHDTDGNWALRGLANSVGVITHAAGITPMPMSKTEREALARKIRGAAKGKSTEEEAAELLKKMDKEKNKDKPKEEKEEKSGDSEGKEGGEEKKEE